MPDPGVVELVDRRHLAAGVAFGFPDGEVGVPIGVVEGNELTVIDIGVEPDRRRVGLAGEDALEPVSLDLGHVTEKSVKRQKRTRHRSALARRVVESFAFEEQGGAVELQPGFEHGPIAEHERRLLAPGIFEVFDQRGSCLSARGVVTGAGPPA
jgi:hypothetical protein